MSYGQGHRSEASQGKAKARQPEYGRCLQGHCHKEGSYHFQAGRCSRLHADPRLLPTQSSRSSVINLRKPTSKTKRVGQKPACSSCIKSGHPVRLLWAAGDRKGFQVEPAGLLQLSALQDPQLGLASRVAGVTWAKVQPVFLAQMHAFHPDRSPSARTPAAAQRPEPTPHWALTPWTSHVLSGNCRQVHASVPLHFCSFPGSPPTSVTLGFGHLITFSLLSSTFEQCKAHCLSLGLRQAGVRVGWGV